MKVQLASANVVVVAQQFNPSVFGQLWLVRNGIVGEDEFGPGAVFTPVVVQVQTANFALLVVPEQLQLTPNASAPSPQDLVTARIGRIVQTLPHTPYRAVGLNFHWHLTSEGDTFAQFNRRLFFREQDDLYTEFDREDARFGAYLSKDVLGCRLKLDIKPMTVRTATGDEERLLLAFNFHRDVGGENAAADILAHLAVWNEATATASRIAELIAKEG